jgi:hypothetical protein
MQCSCNPNIYNSCVVRIDLLNVKRDIRWMLDNSDRNAIQVDEVLSHSYEILKNIGIKCLNCKNS